MHDCKKIKQEYETLQKNAAEFALTVDELRAEERAGRALNREMFNATKRAKRELAEARDAVWEKCDFDFWAVKKIMSLPVVLGLAVACLTAIDTPAATRLRKKIQLGDNVGELSESFAGIDSPEAWRFRDYCSQDDKRAGLGALSWAGLDTDRAWRYRDAWQGKVNNFGDEMGFSLIGLDSERAWEMRERLLAARQNWQVAYSLGGLDSDRAWAMRDILRERSMVSEIEYVYALDSERAWQERERILQRPNASCLNGIARGLAGIDSERAWDMRKRLIALGGDKKDILMGLAGLRSDRAESFRHDCAQDASITLQDLARSYNGSCTVAMAWRTARKQIRNS